MGPWPPLVICDKKRNTLFAAVGKQILTCSANIAVVSLTHVAARAVALDADFGLHFLHVRPPASELDSVWLVGGGRLKKGKTEFVSSAAASAESVGGEGGEGGERS